MNKSDSKPVEVVALNADIVGYSRLIADDFNSTTAVMGEFRHIVAEKVAESDGTLVNFVGDNFMAVFDDPKDAMQAAIGTSGAIEARNADIPPGR